MWLSQIHLQRTKLIESFQIAFMPPPLRHGTSPRRELPSLHPSTWRAKAYERLSVWAEAHLA
jgi:hypothetical protein